jgi:hypothetical protein
MVDISYVGSQSQHNPRKNNLNAPAFGIGFTAAAQDPTKYAGGLIPSAEPGLPSVYSAAGLSFSGANALAASYLSPYQAIAMSSITISTPTQRSTRSRQVCIAASRRT